MRTTRELHLLAAASVVITLVSRGTSAEGERARIPAAAASGDAVETWNGDIDERLEEVIPSQNNCDYIILFLDRNHCDLAVAADGSVSGTITGTLLSADACVDDPFWTVYFKIIQPVSIVRVEGTRDADASGQLRLRISKSTQVQAAQLEEWMCPAVLEVPCFPTTSDIHPTIPKSLIDPRYATYLGAPGDTLRPARLSPSPADVTDSSAGVVTFRYHRRGSLFGQSTERPRLTLESELSQPEIYLRGVTVPAPIRYTATVEWNGVDGGAVTWSLGDAVRRDPPTGSTTQTTFTYDVDAGNLQEPSTPLTAEAVNVLGSASPPQVLHLYTAPPPLWSGGPSSIVAEKGQDYVHYEWHPQLPKTPFEARSAVLRDELPFFGGDYIGMRVLEVPEDAFVYSYGEGRVAGAMESMFHAARTPRSSSASTPMAPPPRETTASSTLSAGKTTPGRRRSV